ncbi:M1 family aminopeptidase [Luteimonas sp. 3794]|uniref:ABC transporter permease/M1 family aminopeptidase n=1 Tax=Luteimonas sp. 3794 TaxID=2817730 RepID=UPI0028669A49|nr:M1 family aminopeptidase [Luteimonas sp. 3794]MDR6992377.1 ABC-type transport system involved in multi-copper enzyme maturation permease subunit [Luteimonas sp. 3794]
MILEFFRFELRQQLRSPLLWFLAALFALLGFGAASSDAVQIGGAIGNVHRNAPVVVAQLFGAFTLLTMLIVPIFVSTALLRDFEQGTADLLFSGPVRRRDYLLGRIGAALLASLAVFVVIAIGLFVAQFMPWIDPARLGPASLQPYLWSLGVIVLPNLLFVTALLALLAVTTRSILWVYIGVLAFFVLYLVSATLMRDIDNIWLATLAEPLGARALSRTVRYWSAEERNSGLPALADYLLANRALWLGVSLTLFASTFALFRTERSGTGRSLFKRRRVVPPVTLASVVPSRAPIRVQPVFGAATGWSQTWRQVHFDTAGVLRSVPFLVMLLFGILNFVPSALLQQSMYGTSVYPVTSQMLDAMRGSYSFLLLIVVMFYAGELVWKERSAKLNEVVDAMPVANRIPLLAKFLTLLVVIALFQLIGMAMAMAVQLFKGSVQLEPLVYAQALVFDSIPYVIMGGLALALQVFANNKFIGYGLLVLVLVAQAVLGMLDFTHNLYTIGSWPNAPYSDMNGYGHFLVGQLAFQGYWGLFVAALLLLAAALWVRGVDGGWRQRLSGMRAQLRGGLGIAFAITVLAFAAVGGVLFWNTNVRNDFVSPDGQLDLQARYERDYKQYESLPQPRIVASRSDIDLRPETQSMTGTLIYTVRNPHAEPIADIHIGMTEDRALVDVDLGGQTLAQHDEALGYRIYRLATPLAPGEEREFRFRVDFHSTGITSGQAQSQFVENGSFFNSRMFPQFGYEARAEISDRNERRKRDLGEPRRMPRLEDEAARANTYLTDDADWIDFSTTICTAPDQIALAPGYIEREFEREGRRCFSYAMDRPMLNFYAFLSARWEVRKGTYKDIPIEVYFDPKHPFNVDRMIEATQKSLAYYEANFTPYQHRQLRIIEFPGYASFAQAFANTVPYSESIGFIADLRDADKFDYVFYVTAHEVAHQWWAHQVIGANVQGATMLSESLSQYSALMVMEQEYGRPRMRQFLKYELDRYLGGRGGELLEELPLYRVENQQYIHYQKGSLVFYRLRDEMGEAALNRALKRFLEDKAYQQPPYTTSRELLEYIRAEARPDQQALITDLFENISFYDNRVMTAAAKRREDGRYDVTLTLHAAKRYADGTGRETEGALDDWIEVGVFARGPSGKERDEKVLYLERHHITTADPVITVTVDEAPFEAGFDPYNKLIDRVSSDNRRRVTL